MNRTIKTIAVAAAAIASIGSTVLPTQAWANPADEAREQARFEVGPKHWLEDYRFLTEYNPQ